MTTKKVNNNIDNGSPIDILYLDVYKRMGLDEHDLSPTTSPLYGFTGDHVIPRGTIKLVVTVKEHSRVSMVMTNFLVIDFP